LDPLLEQDSWSAREGLPQYHSSEAVPEGYQEVVATAEDSAAEAIAESLPPDLLELLPY